MRSWVRWIGRRVTGLRQPVWILYGLGIAIHGGGANRRYRAPEVVGVLRVIERDYRVREAQIEKRKDARAFCRRQMMGKYRGLGDFVPIVLDGSVPEAADQSLIGCCKRAVGDAERLDFV